MKQQAVRVNDDEQDDGGMGAAGYAAVLCLAAGAALLIGALLWLPELYRWWRG